MGRGNVRGRRVPVVQAVPPAMRVLSLSALVAAARCISEVFSADSVATGAVPLQQQAALPPSPGRSKAPSALLLCCCRA